MKIRNILWESVFATRIPLSSPFSKGGKRGIFDPLYRRSFLIPALLIIILFLLIPSAALAWNTYPLVPPESEVGDTLSYLRGQQNADSSCEWQSGNPGFSPAKTTACSIIALQGEIYPIPAAEQEVVTVRIEGASNTLWSGEATVLGSTIIDNTSVAHWIPDPTALGALDEAAQAGGLLYSVTDWGGGPGGLFVDTIDGIGGVSSWWLYKVDGVSPEVGAGAFELGVSSPPNPPHTEILWFESATFAEQPTKLELDKTAVAVGEPVTATVTFYDGAAWQPLAGATVYADTTYTTSAGGTVSISFDHGSSIEAYAEMDGFIRSNRIAIDVTYDQNHDGKIEYAEMIDALMDYLVGDITYSQMIDVLMEYLTS